MIEEQISGFVPGTQEGDAVLNVFVLDAEGDKVPVYVSAAMPDDLCAANQMADTVDQQGCHGDA